MSPFLINCPTCRASLRVKKPEAIGQIISCPKCAGMVMIQPPVAARETVTALNGHTTVASAASWNQIDDFLGDSAVNAPPAKQIAEPERRDRWKGEPPSNVDAMECGRPYTESEMAIPRRRDSWIPFRVRRRRRRVIMTILGALAVGSVAYVGWLSYAPNPAPSVGQPSVSPKSNAVSTSLSDSSDAPNPTSNTSSAGGKESGKVSFASHATEAAPRKTSPDKTPTNKTPSNVIPAEHTLQLEEVSPPDAAAPVDSTERAPRKAKDQFGDLFGEAEKKKPTVY